MPDFKCNFLSVKSLAIIGQIAFHFYPIYCLLQDLATKKIVAQGKILGNLYVLDSDSLFLHFSCNEKLLKGLDIQSCKSIEHSNKDSFSIWHQRLGHSSNFVLEHLSFIPSKLHDELIPCIQYHEAKQQRFPFPNSDSCSDEIFKLIHVDL